jgi:hypothetical protein
MLNHAIPVCNTFDSRDWAQAARATTVSFALPLAHVAGVNPLICVILAAGKRVNKSFN